MFLGKERVQLSDFASLFTFLDKKMHKLEYLYKLSGGRGTKETLMGLIVIPPQKSLMGH